MSLIEWKIGDNLVACSNHTDGPFVICNQDGDHVGFVSWKKYEKRWVYESASIADWTAPMLHVLGDFLTSDLLKPKEDQ